MVESPETWTFSLAGVDLEAAIVTGIVRMLGQRDPATAAHLEAVGMLAHRFSSELGLSDQKVRRVVLSARLIDVGTHAIPLRILRKSCRLEESEWRTISLHPEFSASMIVAFPHLSAYEQIVRSHHERYDGAGYPNGLIGEEIPFESRVIAIVDAFHAMTSARPYAKLLTPHQAIEELVRCGGTQFDAELVRAFANMMHYRTRSARALRSA